MPDGSAKRMAGGETVSVTAYHGHAVGGGDEAQQRLLALVIQALRVVPEMRHHLQQKRPTGAIGSWTRQPLRRAAILSTGACTDNPTCAH